jgi:CheY-like chemotaxis protein
MPGCFVRLSVSDNGAGMRKETINQIFEPFFTTKDVGKGTGLGLATVYGIVKQGGGFINVYSEPGQGTTFKIYIPKTTGETEVLTALDSGPPESGSETFLLVEDDEMVRSMTEIILKNLGHKVISASGPEEALEIFEKEYASIDLLITDVVMPKMNGKELHDRLKSICPELKVLFMSGYTTNVIVHHGVLDKGVHFISKPFSINELAAKIRKTLADA